MAALLLNEILNQTTQWATSKSSERLQDSSFWSLVLGVVIATFVIRFVRSSVAWFRTWSILRSFPGPGGPLTFSVKLYRFCTSHPELDFNVGILHLFLGLARVYNKAKAYRVYIGFRPHIYVYSPEAMEAVLSQSKNVDKTYAYRLLKEWMGTGLITSPGHIWKPRRRLLLPAFHLRIIEDSTNAMNSAAENLATTLIRLSSEEGLVKDLLPHVQRCSLRIICEAAMGVDIETLTGYKRYVKAILDIGESFMHRFVRPWLWNPLFYSWCTSAGRQERCNVKIIRQLSLQAIEARRQSLIEDKAKAKEALEMPEHRRERQCFMDVLLNVHLSEQSDEKQQNKLSLKDICDEVVTFMFAGHDTTTASIVFACYLLGLYPEVQQKVYEELQSVLQGDERPLTLEDIKHLRYLDCVTKESMRLYPPVPVIGRNITEDIIIDGRVVPRGTEVLLFLLALHQDATVFPEPERFNPDRFLPENAPSLHPFACVPFSAGLRNCIGQRLAQIEEKVVLATVVRYCHLTSLDTRDQLQLASEIVLRSKNPLRMLVQPRIQ